MENREQQLLTPTEVAYMLRLTRSGVTKMFHDGLFPNAFQLEKAIRIPLSDVEALKRRPFRSDIESLPSPGIQPEAQAREVV